ncbi:hypothetical protein CBER1_07899 [Cercospora berteroae]|uniref:Exonuclease domain-containing protein n=1 Tax=Cercospora berteroae TaxID=357750 RepID=A0A2S6BUE4_9PEZI|nr:hypothetical protein CBER1_07899 [Cercospora berteroae]
MTNQNQGGQRTFVRWIPRQGHAPTPNTSFATNPITLRRPYAPAVRSPAQQVEPRWDLLLPGEPVACDIEFQNYHIAGNVHGSWHQKAGNDAWNNRLGWISILNTRGEIILDTFVYYPPEPNMRITMPRAPGKTFGVTYNRVKPENGAVDGRIVEAWIDQIFANRLVILHGGTNDRSSFYYQDFFARAAAVPDTQREWSRTAEGEYNPTPGLATLARKLLGRVIQAGGNHGPEEDAKATMDIYLLRHPYDRAAEAARWQAVYRG